MSIPYSYTIEYKAREHQDGWEVYRLTTGQYGQEETHLTLVEDMHEAHDLVKQLTEETQNIVKRLAHITGGRIENKP